MRPHGLVPLPTEWMNLFFFLVLFFFHAAAYFFHITRYIKQRIKKGWSLGNSIHESFCSALASSSPAMKTKQPSLFGAFLTRLVIMGTADFVRALRHLYYTFNLYYKLVGDQDFHASILYHLLHSCGLSRNALHIHKTVV